MMADVDQQNHSYIDLQGDDSDEILLGTDDVLCRKRDEHSTAVDLEYMSGPSSHISSSALEGDITVPGAPEEVDSEFDTLDERVIDTVMRDADAIAKKLYHVFCPKESKSLLREWDWWGPLMLCIFLSMMLQGSTDRADDLNDGGPQFAEVFVIYWVGAVIVTLNIKLLGGSISFFQSVCVLGYCILPLCISLLLCRLILIAEQSAFLFAVRCVTVLIAFGWSTFASTAFLAESQPPNRKALAIYPIFLFYFVISWLIISHTHG